MCELHFAFISSGITEKYGVFNWTTINGLTNQPNNGTLFASEERWQKSMITEFGKKLRNIRMNRGILLKDMAEDLGITPSFLSAVEVGKKNVPAKWVSEISDCYDLTENERKELEKLANDATTNVKIDITQANNTLRSAALAFTRNFDSLTDDEAKQIINLLHRGK